MKAGYSLPEMEKTLDCNNAVTVSDMHCGCRLGLVPYGVKRIKLDDGGWYVPSPFQRLVAAKWHEFWTEFVPRVVRGEPYAIIVNGDTTDGVHHNSVTQISHNPVDQARIAKACLEPLIDRKECVGYFHIRGTEAHVGPSGNLEERLAEELGAKPNKEGQYARYDLWINIGGKCLTHILHHIGTTGSQAYEATAVHKELVEEYAESGRWGEKPPQMIVRSHRHRFIETSVPTSMGGAHAIVTPGWQGRTPFSYKIPGGRLSTPQFGGIVIRQGDEDAYFREKVWTIKRSDTE